MVSIFDVKALELLQHRTVEFFSVAEAAAYLRRAAVATTWDYLQPRLELLPLPVTPIVSFFLSFFTTKR